MNHDAPAEKPVPPHPPAAAHTPARPATVLISSEQLFAGAAEVQIDHRGARYRLKQTSLGKLILTK